MKTIMTRAETAAAIMARQRDVLREGTERLRREAETRQSGSLKEKSND